ncbi:MAG TPA: NAD-dependent epimerase/dehydratase family protein [Gammaproteobacteria bacterium]|nr:NAD-dependent epimerase/dehydratase family protein [Gammaproteobacteria bacterium]
MSNALVVGASSQIGRFLLPQLLERGYTVTAVSRRAPVVRPPVRWLRADLAQQRLEAVAAAEAVVSLAPLGVIVEALAHDHLPRVQRLVAFSSTGALTKQSSTDPREKTAAARLLEAEAAFRRQCDTHSIAWTLFRPTMIYDGIHDKNVALIAGFIRRFGFFPLVGRGAGQRQPVHAADLARACGDVLTNTNTYSRTYNLGGGEVLSYRDMVARIFLALGKKPRCVRIPPSLLRAALATARIVPRYRYLNAAMADRMNQDMAFDLAEAARDFDYRPGPFRLDFGHSCPARG